MIEDEEGDDAGADEEESDEQEPSSKAGEDDKRQVQVFQQQGVTTTVSIAPIDMNSDDPADDDRCEERMCLRAYVLGCWCNVLA